MTKDEVKVYVDLLIHAKNWSAPTDDQSLLEACDAICHLSDDGIIDIITEYEKSQDCIKAGGWTKIFVLNRFCFDIPHSVAIKKMYNKYWVKGGFKIPYDPEELIDGMYPLSYVNGKLRITGGMLIAEAYSSPGREPDSRLLHPVLGEFYFFSKNFPRRKYPILLLDIKK